MSIYAISDLHLSLNNQKPMDIFSGWENYIQKLESNWIKKVKSEDTVIIAGDISWAMRIEDAKQDFKFLDSLPGKKVLIRGNHDYWWSTVRKIEMFFKDNNFNTISLLHNSAIICEDICICGTRGWSYKKEDNKEENNQKILLRECMRLRRSIDVANQNNIESVVFLHYPPIYANEESKEIIDILIENNIKKCYYGHIHGNEATKKIIIGLYKGINFNLISCDYLNFTPLLVV